MDYEGRTGAASLWLSTLAENAEAGEILYDLRIKENHAADEHKAGLTLAFPPEEKVGGERTFLPNFRQGDAIILYERNSDTDNVTNKMVFKGNIEYLTDHEVGIRLRATQQNPSVLPARSLYAIEHDTMVPLSVRCIKDYMLICLLRRNGAIYCSLSARRSLTNHWIYS